jgi:hypothetical protein
MKTKKIIYLLLFFFLVKCNPIIPVIQGITPTIEKTGPIISAVLTNGNTSEKHTPSVNPNLLQTSTHENNITLTTTPNTINIPNYLGVYPYQNALYILRPEIPTVMVTEYIDPIAPILISDDNQRIVFEKLGLSGEREINSVNSDGSENKTLTQIDSIEQNDDPEFMGNDPYNLQWIPKTRKILFSTVYLRVGRPSSLYHRNLFTLDIDTGVINRIYSAGNGGEAWPSPDGEEIIITQRKSLFLASNKWTVLYKDIITYEDYDSMPSSIVWFSDSSRFGTIISKNNRHYSWDNFQYPFRANTDATIWLMETSTGEPYLTKTINNFGSGLLSPTLEYIGYSLVGPNHELFETHISSLRGSTNILLESNPSEFISFSKDGKHFAFTVDTQNNKECGNGFYEHNLFIGSVDGEKVLLKNKVLNGLIRWINESQFIYVNGLTLLIGDINGNSAQIGTLPGCIWNIEAKDIGFHK